MLWPTYRGRLLLWHAPTGQVSRAQEQEWSISNFPCSPTRNIPSCSMENLAFHSLLRWKMIILPILTTSLIHFPLKVGRMYFWDLEVKGLIVILFTEVYREPTSRRLSPLCSALAGLLQEVTTPHLILSASPLWKRSSHLFAWRWKKKIFWKCLRYGVL